jgi:SMI1 / KNR4 family (SUKH-1)
MAVDIQRFLDGLNRRAGATDAIISEREKQLGLKLPAEYVEFLKLTNGGEGFIGKNAYVMLWGVTELASMNQSYEVQEYVPGLLIIGSDGGGEAYGFDTRAPQWPIVQVPFVGMTWDVAHPMGESFGAFLKRLYETE